MSGHSKWATIRRKKGAEDAKRGQLFTKRIKEIMVAARAGGGDEESNPQLRTAILNAKIANMPKENIERAIKKATGDLDGVDYTELMYEAYGPGGVAILIQCLTDNRNRTAADIRGILTKGGGSLGESGSVSYLFRRRGVISIDAEGNSEDSIIEVGLEAGAEDITNDDELIEVVSEPESFDSVLAALTEAGIESSSAEVTMVPELRVALEEGATRKALRLIDNLDEHDDVQTVSSNIDIPDDFDFDAE